MRSTVSLERALAIQQLMASVRIRARLPLKCFQRMLGLMQGRTGHPRSPRVTRPAASTASNVQLPDYLRQAPATLPSSSDTSLESLSKNSSALNLANPDTESEDVNFKLFPTGSSKSTYTTPPVSPVPKSSDPWPNHTASNNTCISVSSPGVPSPQYPSDRANYPVDIADDDIKRCILRNGPCQPEGPFPRDIKGRCFSEEFYNRTSKKGGKIPHPKWIGFTASHAGFLESEVHDHGALGIENEIVKLLESESISIHKCRGQGYDGASAMSGAYSGVQKRILAREPSAIYIHCASHNLNPVLNDACQNVTEVRGYYDTVQKLYVFFSGSIKRWELLEGHLSNSSGQRTLKRLCPMRWGSRNDAIESLRFRYADILQALSKIILLSKKPDERAEAMGLKKAMEKFEFVLMTVMQGKILETVNVASRALQDKNMDIMLASKLLGNALDTLTKLREEFESVHATAEALAESWGIGSSFTHKRARRIKTHFDELCEDQRLQNAKEYFRVSVFCATIDTCTGQLKRRFCGMYEVAKRFGFLCPGPLLRFSDNDLSQMANALVVQYTDDLSSEFAMQLLSFRNALKPAIQEIEHGSIADLAQLLFIRHHSILPSVPDVATALKLFLTLPVTVATAERSFSKLKVIKTFLRSTMSQERLSSLALLSIENARARNIDIKAAVKDFAHQNARRAQRIL
ncbi:Zinc finger MYM-type protein 1 [Anabarilius grahami]|uniref:Zinc finger MYM-type protein 1 n=1 Tax=Anabarilius grahami TaxID=495550 RepID=A0A3N0YWE2_ANAGA|nr:Zinc finger MYM-type protein 1 [Anabarilius grahami]